MNLNKVFVLGRVTHNPDARSTPSGQPVTTLGIATNRTWTDKSGQKQESTEFHTVVAWGKLAELAGAYLAKGALVLVEGRLETRSWNDKDGHPRQKTEIIAEGLQFGPKPERSKPAPATPAPAEYHEPGVQLDGDENDTGREMKELFGEEEIRPEDIPF